MNSSSSSLLLEEWLARLEKAHPHAIELGLERVAAVRDAMGLAPAFPIILVGGTNGKGSTSAYLESILREQGYRTGLYTSPHLLRYNERVRIDGKEADDDFIVRGFDAVERARGHISLTYFEHGTLAAMWQFIESEVEVVILEVGLGGRLDATNVFEPTVSVVTSIDLDHQAWLGETREAIGYEKAGIFRAGKPAVCGLIDPPRTLLDHARSIGAKLIQAGRDYTYEASQSSWNFKFAESALNALPLPALLGPHQIQNAASALAALAVLAESLPVSLAAIRQGLVTVKLPGRFQRFSVDVGQGQVEVVLDVAHNPEAARALAANLRANPVKGKTYAVFALLADKDAENVIRPLVGSIDVWLVGGLAGERGRSGASLAEKIKPYAGENVCAYADPLAAFGEARRRASDGDRIAVFGSFYTVAEILQTLF